MQCSSSNCTKREWYHKQSYTLFARLRPSPLTLLNLVKVGLWPPDTRVVCKVRLDQVRKLRVDVQRPRNLSRHTWDLRLLLPCHALPELFLCGLATVCCARVDGRRGTVAEEAWLGWRGAVVRGQKGSPYALEGRDGAKCKG